MGHPEGYINLTNPILPLFKYSTYLGGGWLDGNEVHKNEEERAMHCEQQ